MDAMENFPEVDFSSIKLNLGAASSLLQTSSEDVILKMMPPLSLPRTILTSEMTPLSES